MGCKFVSDHRKIYRTENFLIFHSKADRPKCMNELEQAKEEDIIDWMDELHGFLHRSLNELHQTNYSKRFWRIATYKYVVAIITKQDFLTTYKGKVRPPLYPVNKLFLTFWEKIYVFITNILRLLKHHQSISKINHCLKEYQIFSINADDYFNKHNNAKLLPFYYPLFLGCPNRNLRKKIDRMAEAQNERLYQNILRFLPKIYVEYFSYFEHCVELHDPASKLFKVLTVNPGFQSFLVARYVEAGSQLYWYQHGGFYGEQEYHRAHHHESTVADRFMTWGWKRATNDCADRAYKLESFYQKYQNYSPSRAYAALIVMPLANSDYKPHYEPLLKKLIPALVEAGIQEPDILIRARSRYNFFGNRNQLDFFGKNNLSFSEGKTAIFKEIRSSRLVILMNLPSTTFLECVAVDHPCIIIPDLTRYDPSELARPYYDFFFDRGVFHRNIESAIQHLHKRNQKDWWVEVISDPTYHGFKNTLAHINLAGNH